ncbi:DNA gyrase subunit A [Nanoarchaeota archaeon]
MDKQQLIIGLIEEEMKTAYVDYAMSVIVGRALPDAKDGLKPVHRRILYAMQELGLRYNSSFKKCARIVGEVLGKYHPHGDSAVYDALVRMAQDFSLRYPLIHGQGNFGSVDGDRPAAMRYTEAKMARIADEMLQDIEKETVKFTDNFDGSLKEPLTLPSKLPNLLVNGSSGIAVGMATNIPPHNMTEVCNAAIAMLDNPNVELSELMQHITGPDFPTGGIIAGRNGIYSAYKTGRGRVRVKARMELEEHKDGPRLVVTEIPYMVNKSMLIEQIAETVKDKKVEGISDLRDESDRTGMRIVLELKRNANAEVVQNMLFKHTRLATTFGVITIALVDNEPVLLTLPQLLEQHIIHRKDVVVKRTKYDLKKAEERAHLLEGLLVALKNIDPVIKLIRAAKTVADAKSGLVKKFKLTGIQANAILDMRLQKLASMEQKKVKDEYAEIQEKIKKFKLILDSKEEVIKIVKSEYKYLIEKYGDERRTSITEDEEELDIEDLIEEEDVVVTITNTGYIKRLPLDTYRAQRRGGTGIIGAKTKEDDYIEDLFVSNTHSYLLVFTDKGKVYWTKVYKIPTQSRTGKGLPIVNLLNVEKGEKIQAVISVREFDDKHHILTATKKGIVKKTNLSAYSNPRKGGIIALTMDDDDELINAKLTDGTKQVILAMGQGNAVRFHENQVRPMGRTARGVIGARLGKGDKVIDMVICEDDKKLLTITENGYGKKTPVSDYRLINRGGKGVINIKTTERNGNVIAVKSVEDNDELIVISKNGIVIRTRAAEISTIGRNTQGVRIMRLKEGDKVMSAAMILNDGT